MLKISNLSATVNDIAILKELSLDVQPGQIHAIMGPNGAGKSTLAKVLAGHPAYEVTGGEVAFEGDDLLDLDPEERAHKGFFMSFQYPVEVPGVTNFDFLKAAHDAKLKAQDKEPLTDEAFDAFMEEKMELVSIRSSMKRRHLNEGFSGGEKKRNEILQLAVLEPKLAVLDETDSGLDIDALKVVAEGVNSLMNPNMSLVIITHYQRLLDYIKPDFVHVMSNGRIIKSGDSSLALELEEKGYDWIESSKES